MAIYNVSHVSFKVEGLDHVTGAANAGTYDSASHVLTVTDLVLTNYKVGTSLKNCNLASFNATIGAITTRQRSGSPVEPQPHNLVNRQGKVNAHAGGSKTAVIHTT